MADPKLNVDTFLQLSFKRYAMVRYQVYQQMYERITKGKMYEEKETGECEISDRYLEHLIVGLDMT